MPNRLIDVKKVGVFCDGIAHSTEKRKDGEVKVVQLALRIQPFDAKLATAIRQDVRQTLFKLNTVEQQPHLDRVTFKLGVPRQNLYLFASPDTTKASLMLDHVKITSICARTEKGVNGLALTFKATFGPASSQELAYVEDWRNSQRFVNTEEAEASLEFDNETEQDEDDDEDAPERPQEMWQDGDEQNPHTGVDSGALDDAHAAEDAEAAERGEREHARHAKPRHSDRKSAARAKQGKKR